MGGWGTINQRTTIVCADDFTSRGGHSDGAIGQKSGYLDRLSMELKVIENATCTFCGCVCDDIELHADDVRIHQAKNRAKKNDKNWSLGLHFEHMGPNLGSLGAILGPWGPI